MYTIIRKENGDPAISLTNVLHKTNTDGMIVGAIHKIIHHNNNIEEITQFFYFKGSVHTARGFSAIQNENIMPAYIAFKTAIESIPILNQFINIKPFKDDGNDYTLVYMMPKNSILPFIKESLGYVSLKQAIEIISEDDKIDFIIKE